MDTLQTPAVSHNSNTEIAISRELQIVQGMIIMAKKFPRDEYDATQRIKRMCERQSLAKNAVYAYPRGGQNVTGPSIRLAEAVAKAWGNIDYGLIELSNQNGQSEMEAYAWDMETNTRASRKFIVNHTRDTRTKGKVQLTDDRDIYEATANFGARRMRACILEVLPSDVVEAAVAVCKETMLNDGNDTPIADRITTMLAVFKKEFKVTKEQIEKFCDRPAGNFGKEELFTLQGVYKAIKDGQATVEAYFPKEAEKAVDISKPAIEVSTDSAT